MNFTALTIKPGILLDLETLQVWGWVQEPLMLPLGATAYGMVTVGRSLLHDAETGPLTLGAGMFFVLPDGGSGLIIILPDYRGLRQIGGPLEPSGRLRYIDGCSDTLLSCPPRLGEPCLNHLHIPHQTPHTHPSARIRIILNGTGEYRTSDRVYPLQPGMGWYIPTGCLHSFLLATKHLMSSLGTPTVTLAPAMTIIPRLTER